MPAIFKYHNKIYQCMNLQKKLKKLKASSVDILWEGDCSQSELENKFLDITNARKEITDIDVIKLYKFYNSKTKHTITSIYPTLNDLNHIININDYTQVL